MGLNLNTSISIITVFIQGLLSFFSPCILPIIPLYIAYFSSGASKIDENGDIIYPRAKTFLHTIFFVLGISVTFFILGLSFTGLGRFFNSNQSIFSKISGIIMILFGFYQLGLFKIGKFLEKERRFSLDVSKFKPSPLSAFLLGFTFSFSWTPCIGPVMSGVLLLAGSSATFVKGISLIAVYVLGFIIPFLLTGLFTGSILNLLKKHRNIVKYTVKIGACLLILMGLITLSGFMGNISSSLNGITNTAKKTQQTQNNENKADKNTNMTDNKDSNTEKQGENSTQKQENTDTSKEKKQLKPAVDFDLVDQYGNRHKLSDYKGKTIFLNFWATWCPPCRAEMPDIQALYEKYGENKKDVIILGVSLPNIGNEKDPEGIAQFMKENSYTYPTLMDADLSLTEQYGIRAYPTTFMINANGDIFGFVTGGLDKKTMENIINQTIESTK